MIEQCRFWLNSQILVRRVAGSSVTGSCGRFTSCGGNGASVNLWSQRASSIRMADWSIRLVTAGPLCSGPRAYGAKTEYPVSAMERPLPVLHEPGGGVCLRAALG